ncbi:MAG: site-specific integrase [Limosilactobacillus gorillae]|jgi:integrase|uniref:tyrosine-type recombinase/integrase n=1 Tax=Limosilactobacillus gorillae TaxID=1450649 RepID=UPI000AC30C13|nr:site-specific integrase [Limosilactobacillus gorillae]MDO4855393.1 site-specific integrase [Limosilactobacillus gorillae]
MILQAKIAKIMSQVNHIETIHGISLQKLVNDYLNNYKPRVRRSTYANAEMMCRSLVKSLDKDALIEKITPLILTRTIENMIYGPQHISNAYASKFKIFLHQLFAFAVKKSYLNSNPAEKLEIAYRPSEGGSLTRSKFLETYELNRLLKYAYKHNTYAVLCECQTGMRCGEALALSVSDVEKTVDGWVAHVNGMLEYTGLKVDAWHKIDQTKTPTEMRDVALSKQAVEIYHDRYAYADGHGYLFTTKNHTPIQISAFNTFLRNTAKKLEINKPVGSHIFRHTHISKLAELSVPMYAIQQRVGHSNSRVTQEIHTHVTHEALVKNRDKLENL